MLTKARFRNVGLGVLGVVCIFGCAKPPSGMPKKELGAALKEKIATGEARFQQIWERHQIDLSGQALRSWFQELLALCHSDPLAYQVVHMKGVPPILPGYHAWCVTTKNITDDIHQFMAWRSPPKLLEVRQDDLAEVLQSSYQHYEKRKEAYPLGFRWMLLQGRCAVADDKTAALTLWFEEMMRHAKETSKLSPVSFGVLNDTFKYLADTLNQFEDKRVDALSLEITNIKSKKVK